MRFETHSEADTAAFGEALGALLRPGDAVLLSGDLGAGKSVLARGIARALGVEGPMPSPSFLLMIPYEGREKLCHFDLYRLSDPEEFYAAGLDEFIGTDAIAVIEWPEMAQLPPCPSVKLRMERGKAETVREIVLETEGMERPLVALANWRIED